MALGSPVWLLALVVRERSGPLVALDERVVRAATDLTTRSGLTEALVVLQAVTEPVVLHALAAGVLVRTARRAGRGTAPRGRASWAFATMMVSWATGAALKLLVERPRPVLDVPLARAAGYSFPSGHALNATVAAAALLVLLWPAMTPVRRRLGVAAASLLVLGVGLDRVLLGVHHPSDVVGGVVLGGCFVTASWWGFTGPAARVPRPD